MIGQLHLTWLEYDEFKEEMNRLDWIGPVGTSVMSGWLNEECATTVMYKTVNELQHSLKEADRMELDVSLLVSTSSQGEKSTYPHRHAKDD